MSLSGGGSSGAESELQLGMLIVLRVDTVEEENRK
jgi:hypothetical protein